MFGCKNPTLKCISSLDTLDKGTSNTSKLLAFVELRKTVLLLVAYATIDPPLWAEKIIIIVIDTDIIIIGTKPTTHFKLLLLFSNRFIRN